MDTDSDSNKFVVGSRAITDDAGVEAEIFRQQLDGLSGVLAAEDPNQARTNWTGVGRSLDCVVAACEWLLDNLDQIDAIADDPTTAQNIRIHITERCASAAALLYAGMRMKQAKALLERSAQLCPDPKDQEFYRAGIDNLDPFCRAIRAKWLFQHDQHQNAKQLAISLRSASPPIAEFARQIERAPRPIKSAPATFSINGCGMRFYGGHDPEPDGSEIRVRYATVLYFPILPIDAYRMRDHGDGAMIRGQVELSPVMRVWKYGALGLAAVALTWALASAYLDSPERKLGKQIDEVATLAKSDPEAALDRYEALINEYATQIEPGEGLEQFERIAEGWVEVATAQIPEPITPDAVDQVSAITARYASLPGRMHQGSLTDPFVDRLLGWVDELGAETPRAADASLDLLTTAQRFASPGRLARVSDSTRATRIALAELLAVDWPLEAVRQYAQLLDDPRGHAAMQRVLREIPPTPSLLADVGKEVDAFLRAPSDDAELLQNLTTALTRAAELGADPERGLLLASADEAGLRSALEADPTDQVLAVALADVLRGRGELDAAVALLDTLGKPGLRTHDAQYLTASLAFDQGRLDDAAALLEQMLGNRLPAFEDARRAYDAEFERLRDHLIDRAEKGDIPLKYTRITSEDVEVAQRAFGEWLEDESASSAALPLLQESYMRQADIVPVAVLLGTVQLQRARTVTGDERQRLLDSAEATFLSIRGEAGGMPDYHMALAQVYHRLGKSLEGDAEFQILIDDPDANVALLAASGYRELGQIARARELSEAIYERAEPPAKHRAAVLRALLASDLDDRQTWFERGDPNDEFVRTSMLELEGDRLLRDGKFTQADAKYAQAYALYSARAEREHGSFNNAALALISRHACTGDIAHVDAAIELMKASVAINPDDAIVLANQASLLEFRANLELLDRFVPTKGLRIRASEASSLLAQIHTSSLHDQFVAAVRDAPGRARALEIAVQLETLAPQMPAPYFSQATWHMFGDNAQAMTKLAQRIREANIDTSTAAGAYLEDLAGERDEQAISDYTVSLSARAAVRVKAGRGSAATRAALLQLDGLDLLGRARIHGISEPGLADIRAAVTALEQAQALWPEGLSTDTLSDALVLLAVHEVAGEDPELLAYWSEHARSSGTAFTLLGLLEREDPVVAKLVVHPGFSRSLALREHEIDLDLDLLDLAVAKLSKREDLRARTLAAMTSPLIRAQYEFALAIAPYDDQGQRALELLAAEAG